MVPKCATINNAIFFLSRLPQKPQYGLMLQRRERPLPWFEMKFFQPRAKLRVEHNPPAQLRDRAPRRGLRKIGLCQFAKINCSHTIANIRFMRHIIPVDEGKKLPIGNLPFTYG